MTGGIFLLRAKPELGKYLLWLHFSKNKQISPYLPATRRLNHEAFVTYLRRYQMIYAKPSGGSMGIGIMKIWTKDDRVFVKKTVLPTRSFATEEAAWRYIRQQQGGKPYIVQQGLRLATIDGRVFDIRVMMQRTAPGGPWKYSGMLAKVAGHSSVVTNVALSKGSVLEIEPALKRAFRWNEKTIQEKTALLKSVALRAANHFDTYQKYRELGFDMAFDANGKLWMIEQNTGPSHPLFKRLKSNLRMWRLIEYRYGQYQRARQGLRR
jgi:hypothetical protein